MMPVSETCDRIFAKLRIVGKDGLATVKKMTSTKSVISGAMLRSWPLIQAERLGDAELLWSRVSREPYATVALRPGVVRPGVETSRPNVARAGTWTDTGWPATMESAVRSGRAAAQHILSAISARVTA